LGVLTKPEMFYFFFSFQNIFIFHYMTYHVKNVMDEVMNKPVFWKEKTRNNLLGEK